MTLPEAPQNAHEDITPEEARSFLSAGIWEVDPAVKLVLADAEMAEASELSRQYVLGWVQAQTLYQSPFSPRYWPGTQTEAASISFFTVATAVNGIVPQVMAGLFYENPPFMVQERPGTTAQVARALSALLAYQVDDCDFRAELKLGIANCLLFGTSMFQWGWEKFTRERKIVKRSASVEIPSTIPGQPATRISSGELEEEVVEEIIDQPTFEHIVDLREILVDPGLRVPDIRKAKYVIRRRYMTWDDLDKLRDRDGYDIPSRDDLLMLFFPPEEQVDPGQLELGGRNPTWEARAEPRWNPTTADPFQKPLEVLERWDNDTYIVVLNKKLVIYSDKNIYGKIPFLSIGWWNIPGGFWSLGLGRTIGSEQRLMTGITNLLLDNASLNLQTPLVRVRGKSIPTQSIRIAPGKIIEVDSQGDLEPLKRLPAIPEAGELMAMSQGRADTVSGNNPITGGGQAGSSGHSNLARSSAGAQALAQGASSGISEFIDNLADQVIVPLLYEFQEMNRALLPESQLDHIMSEELEHEYVSDGGDVIDILNARVKFSILAGSKMQTRRNMAQGLPLLSQFLANPAITAQLAVEGKKISVEEICRMWFEASDWRNLNDVIVPMTSQDMQRQQQQSQGGKIQQQAQAQSQLQQQKFNQQQQLADEENVARAARDVLREGFKKSVEPSVLTGEPNTSGVGFGGEA